MGRTTTGDPSPVAKKPMQASIYVHATPAAAIAEMDARHMAEADWLSDRALELAAVAALMGLDSDDPTPLPGEPDPVPSSFPDEVHPTDPIAVPQHGPDVGDPAAPPSPGLPGGVPGGPPDVPGVN